MYALSKYLEECFLQQDIFTTNVAGNIYDDIHEDVIALLWGLIGIYQKSSGLDLALAHPPWKHTTVLPAALALYALFAHGEIQPERALQLKRTCARWFEAAPPFKATILT